MDRPVGRHLNTAIPDNKTNREITLVLRRFTAGAIVAMAGGVFPNNANAPAKEVHHPSGDSQIISGVRNARQVRPEESVRDCRGRLVEAFNGA